MKLGISDGFGMISRFEKIGSLRVLAAAWNQAPIFTRTIHDLHEHDFELRFRLLSKRVAAGHLPCAVLSEQYCSPVDTSFAGFARGPRRTPQNHRAWPKVARDGCAPAGC